MGDEIEVVSDGEGALVFGHDTAVRRFLERRELLSVARSIELGRLREWLDVGGDVLDRFSRIGERSGMYLKLTPESRGRLIAAGGLMPTKTKGISHAMLGKTGDPSMKWLQVDTGISSLLANPAILRGVGGLLTQVAQQVSAREMRELLAGIDEKLDDVRVAQRNTVIAKMQTAAAQIENAKILAQSGGDPKTIWTKVHGAQAIIFQVQEETMLALRALVNKAHQRDTDFAWTKVGALKNLTSDIEQDVVLHLSVLARCFELYDEYTVIELDHVRVGAPHRLEGHRLGIAESRAKRRDEVLGATERLIRELDQIGTIAQSNVILHPKAARAVVSSLNKTVLEVSHFLKPLGVTTARNALTVARWHDALRDPVQRATARREGWRDPRIIGAGVSGLAFFVMRRRGESDENESYE